MSFIEKRYMVTDHYGDSHSLTAKQLCERIMQDSKSYFNWIAPAKELIRVCKESSFPAEYALTIKTAILNCFSGLEHQANCGGDHYSYNPEDEEAVQYCYNSLYGIDKEEAVSARKTFLTEMINTASFVRVFDPLYHRGPTFKKLREDWRKSKFEEYFSQEEIDFKQLVETLRSSFFETIKTAESNGDFEEDDKIHQENWKMSCQKIMNI